MTSIESFMIRRVSRLHMPYGTLIRNVFGHEMKRNCEKTVSMEYAVDDFAIESDEKKGNVAIKRA